MKRMKERFMENVKLAVLIVISTIAILVVMLLPILIINQFGVMWGWTLTFIWMVFILMLMDYIFETWG